MNLFGQIDREFWFAVPEVTNSHADRPIYINIVAQSRPCDVTIDIPANSNFTPIKVSLLPDEFARIDLTNWIDLLENIIPEAELSRGLHITSTDMITSFYETSGVSAFSGNVVNTDIFALKGSNALGTEFMIPFQTTFRNQQHNVAAWSSFDIVATEDSTEVTIIPTKNTFSHTINTPFTITLQRGETYSVRASGPNPIDHMSGSSVKSSKPICITVKDDSVILPAGGSNDLVGDQLIPIDKLGTEFIVQGGHITILAIKDSTVVEFDGVVQVTLDSAQSYDHTLPGSQDYLYIETTEPIYLQQIKDFGGEMGGALIPHIQCTGSYDVSFSRGTIELLRLTILVRDGSQGNFTLDNLTGPVGAGSFSPVPGNTDWVMADIGFTTNQLSVGSHRIENSTSPFHLGVQNGSTTSGFRYGYFSNFNLLELGIDIDACSGSVLDAGNGKDSYLWSTGDTSTSIDIDSSGTYWALVTEGGCIARDTINAIIRPGIEVNLRDDTTLCLGDSILLIAEIIGQEDTILWNGVTGDSTYLATGGSTVAVTVQNAFDCSDSDIISINQIQGPERQVPFDTISCDKTLTLNLLQDPSLSYQWLDATGNVLSSSVQIEASNSGEYVLLTNSSCGILMDTVQISFRDVTVPNIITPNQDGVNESFILEGVSLGDWEFDLYNRWGRRVLRTSDLSNILQNTELADGMYYYGLKDETCDLVYKGWLKVVR